MTLPHLRRTQNAVSSPSALALRLELLHSLDLTLWILFILSYILSPSHLLTFVLRLVAQAQFGAPRLVHPHRSLKFFTIAWFVLNLSAIVVHLLDGSRGTKGSDGWIQRGLFVDFVGQVVTPSRIHLFLLDLLISILQFLVIVVAFAEPPSTLSIALARVAGVRFQGDDSSLIEPRDYSSLLGHEWNKQNDVDDDDEDEDEQEDDFEDFLNSNDIENDQQEQDNDDILFDANSNNRQPPHTTNTRKRRRRRPSWKEQDEDSLSRRTVSSTTTAIDIRWSNLWKELTTTTTGSSTTVQSSDRQVEQMEEGRVS
ncbi:hypothetical protein OIO90_004513 [Microbotryomycetes sp. JL221]|nr:hypothetical protein OIO90_004513 [Microbotryomycetes sp. JL221]